MRGYNHDIVGCLRKERWRKEQKLRDGERKMEKEQKEMEKGN